jgi:hypothetical protein
MWDVDFCQESDVEGQPVEARIGFFYARREPALFAFPNSYILNRTYLNRWNEINHRFSKTSTYSDRCLLYLFSPGNLEILINPTRQGTSTVTTAQLCPNTGSPR